MLVDRAIVLAAGLGTRLKWLTRDRPKALMVVADQPVIAHVLYRLAAQGVRDVVVNAHYHADNLIHYLGDGRQFGLRLRVSREEALLDSGGGIATALPLLPGSGLFAVHNVDVLADIELSALAARCPADGGCLALVPNPAHHPAGDFALANGCVLRGDTGARPYTYAGVAVFDAGAFASCPQQQPFPLIDVLLALADSRRLCGVVHRGSWLDIGRPRDLIQARKFRLEVG